MSLITLLGTINYRLKEQKWVERNKSERFRVFLTKIKVEVSKEKETNTVIIEKNKLFD